MNISSVNTSQVSTAVEQGGDYGVAVALKIKEQMLQQGEAAVKLIESAPKPQTDGVRGTKFSAYA